jgi:hypothetical protein
MAESPADLAVAFRSFGRRLDEALAPTRGQPKLLDEGSPSPRQLADELLGVVRSAAQEVPGVDNDGDVRALGSAVGDAIARTPSEDWDDAHLDRLRALALQGGGILRQIEAMLADAR